MAETLNDTLGGDLATRDYPDARLAHLETGLNADIAATKAEILKWIFAAQPGRTAVLAALGKLL